MVFQFPPWRHESDLAMVRDWFFPGHAKQDLFSTEDSGDTRQRAIDKVNLWIFKAGQIPAAVLATSRLTEALLHDGRRRNSPSVTTISDSAMQSIYAMAFARFVNAFVDRDVARTRAADVPRGEQNSEDEGALPAAGAATGKGENSMYAHATTIGMPVKFVDLRHRVTHADIPNLPYLRKMTEEALEWLWERWWVKHATGSPDRALRELAERQRISGRARETRQLGVQDGDAALSATSNDTIEDVDMLSAHSHAVVE